MNWEADILARVPVIPVIQVLHRGTQKCHDKYAIRME